MPVLSYIVLAWQELFTDLVWEHWLETAAEIAEVISIFVDLHTLAIIFDLGVHPVGALLHGVLHRFTGLCLSKHKQPLLL